MEEGVSFAATLLQKCRDTRQLKRAHSALQVRGLAAIPSSPGLLRSAFSHAALHPSGDLHYAFLLLLSLPFSSSSYSPRNLAAFRFLYNTVIRGFARQPRSPGALSKACLVFRRMIRAGVPPSGFTFTFLLQACASGGSSLGVQLHAAAVKNAVLLADVCVRNSLIRLYSDSGAVEQARRVFDEGIADGRIDVVSWNSLIDGCLNSGDVSGALLLFDRMPDRNAVTLNSVIAGLVKNERLDAARCLFDEMPDKNAVSWTVMISGYVHNGEPQEALTLFREMLLARREPNAAALASALAAASQLASLNHGQWIHAYIRRHCVRMDPSLSTAIITMYANCGGIELATQFFRALKPAEKDQSTYTAAIFALAMNSHGREALLLFEQMKSQGFKPDRVSYLAALFCCSHMGWVDLGFHYFRTMVNDDAIPAELDHYACMVDLLGRAGLLKEAEDFISSMPVEPDSVIWGALLNACRIHGSEELGRRVGELMIESDGSRDVPYILLSNLLVDCKSRGRAERVRRMLKTTAVKRTPGFSCVEINGVVHEFFAGTRAQSRKGGEEGMKESAAGTTS